MSEIPEFTKKEIQTAIDQVKRGKCSDSNGIRAEDIKGCDDEAKDMVRQIINKVLEKDDGTPETWRRMQIKVIDKKGGVKDVGNHRPICTLPALYNLLSTLLYIRFYPKLDLCQPADQGGSRRSYQTVDYLMAYSMLEQRRREWVIPMFISTIDSGRHSTE